MKNEEAIEDMPLLDCPKCGRKETMYWDSRTKLYICPWNNCDHVVSPNKPTDETCKTCIFWGKGNWRKYRYYKKTCKRCSNPKKGPFYNRGIADISWTREDFGCICWQAKCQPKESKPDDVGEFVKELRTWASSFPTTSEGRRDLDKAAVYIEQLRQKNKELMNLLDDW